MAAAAAWRPCGVAVLAGCRAGCRRHNRLDESPPHVSLWHGGAPPPPTAGRMLVRHANRSWCSPSAPPPPQKRKAAAGVAVAGLRQRVGKDKAIERHGRHGGPSQGAGPPRRPVAGVDGGSGSGCGPVPVGVRRGDALAHHRHGRVWCLLHGHHRPPPPTMADALEGSKRPWPVTCHTGSSPPPEAQQDRRRRVGGCPATCAHAGARARSGRRSRPLGGYRRCVPRPFPMRRPRPAGRRDAPVRRGRSVVEGRRAAAGAGGVGARPAV